MLSPFERFFHQCWGTGRIYDPVAMEDFDHSQFWAFRLDAYSV